jgi:O-antigen/teichoic acid export membrane protein/GT2 family glycosyltransferase
MSLTDKVIKNTFYHLLSQIVGFLFPFILTPIIISKIGEVEFGIYAIAIGFIGTFGLFDLSISSSFIKFISEHYNKKETVELNDVIGTGIIFYLLFSLFVCAIGYVFTDSIISIIKVPENLKNIGVFAVRISLVIFFIANTTTIFLSILISLQKMYVNSLVGIIISFLNFISIYVLLAMGFGLRGLFYSQLTYVGISGLFTTFLAKKYLPEMTFSLKNLRFLSLRKMLSFGIQMQTSKVAGFLTEKYDEFLLAYFSVLSNVTYFNLGGRVARLGRFLPFQLIPQVAPIAAELNAKAEAEKLNQLFDDTTKYLTVISVPIFIFLFAFADAIMITWMGSDKYYLSVQILRILVVGQLANLIFSAPGNSITPNIGIPKFQMLEGIINLIINLILSYILIKNYGITGAAIGATAAISISALYILYESSKYFGRNTLSLISGIYFKPLLAGIISIAAAFGTQIILNSVSLAAADRPSGIILLIICGIVFTSVYSVMILRLKLLNQRDKAVMAKIVAKVIPIEMLLKSCVSKYKSTDYENELVSLCIVTHNRVDFLKKTIAALKLTLTKVNYELFIWDNNSNDGTVDYLKQFENDIRTRVILHKSNIGTNAKGKTIELTKGEFIFGLDDDILEFPKDWIQQMVHAYKSIPNIGYLSTDVIQDEKTHGAKQPDEMYSEQKYCDGSITLLVGPAGGWCFMISRDTYNTVGKFYFAKDRIFFMEDENYANRVINKGLKVGILKDLKVYHATGATFNKDYKQVFDNKMNDYLKGHTIFYKIKQKLASLLSPRKYLAKIDHLSKQ